MNVDRKTIQNRCSDAVLERGETYRSEGRIQQRDRFDDLVTASVRGSTLYRRYKATARGLTPGCVHVHEEDLEKAFAALKDSENLSWLRRYRDPVATVDPVAYFEVYREQFVPFAAGETGRRHYREIADHLDEMQELVPEERFEEFVDFLKDQHSNRPAFLDELEKAGF